MLTPQLPLSLHEEIFIDNFAGGGGASTGIERALRRAVDEALNHDRKALAMHRMNHPTTRHHREDIRHADPLKIAGNRRVGGIWFSPDCKHHSKARGGKPRDKKIRGLAWSVVHWVNVLRGRPVGGAPRKLYLENVEEFQDWCPLDKDDKPSTWRPGWFFLCFTGALFRRGYAVEWAPGDGHIYRRTGSGIERIATDEWSARACDFGTPTIRRRLYLIASSDGRAIVWPRPTHADPSEARSRKLKPHKITADYLDFRLPCPSIFLNRQEARVFKKATGIQIQRPLAQATMTRIAKGVDRYVLKAKKPFIVDLTHEGNDGLVAAYVAQHNGGATGHQTVGHPLDKPVSTLSAKCSQQQIVAASLLKYYGADQDPRLDEAAPTVTTKDRFGIAEIFGVIPPLTPELEAGARRVAKFLREHGIEFEGEFAPVGDYIIVDIGMRMLKPRELYLLQGFPVNYIIERGLDEDDSGRVCEIKLTGTQQVRMCGNSVCPPMAEVLVAANNPEMRVEELAA